MDTIAVTSRAHGRYFRFRFYNWDLHEVHTETIFALDEESARTAAWFALAFQINGALDLVKARWRVSSIQIAHALEQLA